MLITLQPTARSARISLNDIAFIRDNVINYGSMILSRTFKFIIVLSLVTVFHLPSGMAIESGQPAQLQPEQTALRKLQRGFLNIALSPIEISHELSLEKKRDTFPPSWFLALGRGSAYAAGRTLTGVYEMLTFPFPMPAHYAPVVLPEFTWQHLPAEPYPPAVSRRR